MAASTARRLRKKLGKIKVGTLGIELAGEAEKAAAATSSQCSSSHQWASGRAIGWPPRCDQSNKYSRPREVFSTAVKRVFRFFLNSVSLEGSNGGKKESLIMFPQGGPAAARPAAPAAAAPAAAPAVLCCDYSFLLTH